MQSSPRIVVVGSANLDYQFRIHAAPRPGETVLSDSLTREPGGKGANQAVAAQRAGGTVSLVGCVGDDDDGAAILRRLRAESVDTAEIEILSAARTGIAIVTVADDGENTIVVAAGANGELGADRVTRALARLLQPGTIVVVQAEISHEAIRAAGCAAEEAGARFVLNLAPFTRLDDETIGRCDPLIVNETEAEAMLAAPVTDVPTALEGCRLLAKRSRSAVITLGSRGAVWFGSGIGGHEPAPRVDEVVDTTGAGDAFVGALAVGLGIGQDLAQAVEAGVTAGSLAVGRFGAQASYPRASEVARAAP